MYAQKKNVDKMHKHKVKSRRERREERFLQRDYYYYVYIYICRYMHIHNYSNMEKRRPHQRAIFTDFCSPKWLERLK